MLQMLRGLVSQKVQMRLIIQGIGMKQAALSFQSIIIKYGVPGVMNVSSSTVDITVEGPRSHLEAMQKALFNTHAMPRTTQSKVAFLPYKGNYEEFRVAFG